MFGNLEGQFLEPKQLEVFNQGDVFVPEQVEFVGVVAASDLWVVIVVELKHVEQDSQKFPELRGSTSEDFVEIGQGVSGVRRNGHSSF